MSFACQRCLQPVKLDESLNSFGEHLLAELTGRGIVVECDELSVVFVVQCRLIQRPMWIWSRRRPAMIIMCIRVDFQILGMVLMISH